MAGAQQVDPELDIDLRQLLAGLRRVWLRHVMIAAAVTLLALAVAAMVAPRYYAESRILIETSESEFTRPDNANAADELDGKAVTSQVELLVSNDILRKVAQELGLDGRPEFDEAARFSPLGRFLAMVGLKRDPGLVPLGERVLRAMRKRLDVFQVPDSRVIVIGFSSTDPAIAAGVPRAISAAYLELQREALHRSATAAMDWLEGEIKDLRERVREAESRIAAFRSGSYLPPGRENAPLATQQLSELASQMSHINTPANGRVFAAASVPNEPYFPKFVPIAISAFAVTLLLLLLATLLRDLFSGRALRQMPIAPRSRTSVRPTFPRTRTALSPPPVELAPVSAIGLNVVAAGKYLRVNAATHAIFISPEGDDASVLSVRVAREVADAGRRVVLVDLTASGAAAGPMLDGIHHDGITDLLAAQAQFTDIIHSDCYSDCDVIPVGNADPVLAMRNSDRLPILLQSLSSAYDLVVVECGPADAADVLKLSAPEAEILVSSVGRRPTEVDAMLEALRAAGCERSLLVSLSGLVSDFLHGQPS